MLILFSSKWDADNKSQDTQTLHNIARWINIILNAKHVSDEKGRAYF